MQHSIGDSKIGPVTHARPQRTSNHHSHHLQPLLYLPNKLVMTLRLIQTTAPINGGAVTTVGARFTVFLERDPLDGWMDVPYKGG